MSLTLSSCERIEETVEIKESRPLSTYTAAPKPLASSAERFYDNSAQETAAAPAMENFLDWTTPSGWKDIGARGSGAAGGMRLIDLRFGGNDEGECYLSAMPGAAGGVEANINRWRAQMGLPALTAEEVATLPKKTLFGREATFVSFDGDFTNVGAASASKGYRLIGLVQPSPEYTLFVKATGPKDLVVQNEQAFIEFYQSINIKR